MSTSRTTSSNDSQLFRRLAEVLELKGYDLERLTAVDPERPAIVARATVFRNFSDPYFVDLSELPDDEEVGWVEWREFCDRMSRAGIDRGVLVTDRDFNAEIVETARERGHVALFTFDELLTDLIDFRPYLENVLAEWQSDPLHSGEVVIPAQGTHERDGARFPLDDHVDGWLTEPGRDPLFIVGRYGAGKTTFVKRLCARLARAYLGAPVGHCVPLLMPLREYANLTDMEELLVARIAELAPEQAPPSRRAFRLLLEAGRFCLVLDGLDELIRRLEPNYVRKNFDKLCSLVVPGTKAILTAREGYLGTPQDEAQLLGVGQSDDERRPDDPPRFERVFLQPVDRAGIQWYIGERYPDRAEHYRMVVETRSELLDLATTPLLLELMLRSLPLLEGRIYVNPAVVMTAFIDSWAELGRASRSILTTADEALFFATELAWQMHWAGIYEVHFTELSGRIRSHFRDRLLAVDAPDPFRSDLRECPFIAIDRNGNYRFGQNAFLDFLSALAFMRHLVEHGTAPVDNRRVNPDMQRFVRDLATMDERYMQAYHGLLDELRGRDDPTQWLFYRDLLPAREKNRIFAAEMERVHAQQSAAAVDTPDGMVHVSGGVFIFGSFEHRDEAPVKRMDLDPFFIDVSPVTNAQYLEFLEATDHRRPLWSDGSDFAWVDGEPPDDKRNFPVTMINVEDAQAFATWAGKRLPTEQEWELAARGYEGRRFPWGDEFDPMAANGGVGDGGVSPGPVGVHPDGVSVFGGHDFAGQVWEWTASRYERFAGLTLRVVRGGSYRSTTSDELRAAFRMFWDPSFPRVDIGFRCVRSVG